MRTIVYYIAALISTTVAHASQHNQRMNLPGSHAAEMGGAYTAVCNDASAIYYNPAGLVNNKKGDIGVSTYAYQTSETSYEEAINEQAFTEESDGMPAGFVGAYRDFGFASIGYAVMSLESKQINQKHEFEDLSEEDAELASYNRTQQENSSYTLAAAGAGLQLSKSISIGASGFYYIRDMKISTHQLARFNGGAFTVMDSKYETTNYGLGAIVGTMLRLDNWNIAFSTKQASPLNNRTVVTIDTVMYDGSADPDDKTTENISHMDDELNPPQYVVAAAYTGMSNLVVDAEVLYHQGVQSQYYTGWDLEDVVNFSVGAELRMKSIEIRAGTFSNYSLAPEIASDKRNQLPHVDYLGYSIGVGLNTNRTSYSLSVITQEGEGDAQIVSGSTDIQNVIAKQTLGMMSINLQH